MNSISKKDKGIQIRYENETLWMTQKAMAELFDVEQPAIAKHLINIYNERELDKNSTYSKMELVQKEGTRNVKRNVEFYNLDGQAVSGTHTGDALIVKFVQKHIGYQTSRPAQVGQPIYGDRYFLTTQSRSPLPL